MDAPPAPPPLRDNWRMCGIVWPPGSVEAGQNGGQGLCLTGHRRGSICAHGGIGCDVDHHAVVHGMTGPMFPVPGVQATPALQRAVLDLVRTTPGASSVYVSPGLATVRDKHGQLLAGYAPAPRWRRFRAWLQEPLGTAGTVTAFGAAYWAASTTPGPWWGWRSLYVSVVAFTLWAWCWRMGRSLYRRLRHG